MSDFLHMGGYAFYVWSAYILAFFVLIINWLGPYFKHKANIKSARDFHQLNRDQPYDT
jgi:heme exporter protein D